MADAAATTAVAATAVLSSLERRMPGALVSLLLHLRMPLPSAG